MEQTLQSKISEYNSLVSEWNDSYGHICSCIPVSEEELTRPLLARIKTKFSSQMTGRKKLSYTETIMNDFTKYSLRHTQPIDGTYTKGELAYLIRTKSKKIRSEL